MSKYRLIRLKRFSSLFTVKLCNELFFQLHLILHVYVRRFDVIDTVENFLETKNLSTTLKLQAQRRKKKNLNLSTKACIRSKTKQWSAQSHHQVGDGLRRAHRRSMFLFIVSHSHWHIPRKIRTYHHTRSTVIIVFPI